MISRVIAGLSGLAVVIGLMAYGLVAHRYTITDDRSDASYLFACAWIIGILAVSCAMNRAWLLTGFMIIAGAGFTWWFARYSGLSPTWAYLLQHAGVHAALAIVFALSLRRQADPVISRLARIVHGTLTPERARYTRGVTIAWSIFFAVMALTSVTLFASGHMLWWSWLVNILALPLTALMFIAEYLVRLRYLSQLDHVGLSAGIQAWRQHGGDPTQTESVSRHR